MKNCCCFTLIFWIFLFETEGKHYQPAPITEELCQLQFLSSTFSKTECTLKCLNKEKLLIYKDGKCYCTEKECLKKQRENQQITNRAESGGTMYQLFIPKRKCYRSDFAIEFLQPTVNVPVLPNKEMLITDEMTFTVWFYTNKTIDPSIGWDVREFFTMPRNHITQDSVIQCFIKSQQRLTCFFKGLGIGTSPDAFELGRWNHVVVTIQQITSSFVKWNYYVNWRMVFSGTRSKAVKELPVGEPYKGIVLANDVDGNSIYDPTQYFPGKLSKLYIYNTILSDSQIKEMYYGEYATENQVLSWEEFLDMEQEGHTKQLNCETAEIYNELN